MKVFRYLFLIWLLIGNITLAGAQDKPKATLFDEFGKINQAELKKRISAFDERLRKNAWSENYENAVIFFYSINEREAKKAESSVVGFLYDNCRDCRGWNLRITFVRAGIAKQQKIQLWIVPQGADNPSP
jgi:hypothetical protein